MSGERTKEQWLAMVDRERDADDPTTGTPTKYCAECGEKIRHGARGLCLKCFVDSMPTESRGCDCAWIGDRLVRGRCHE